MNKERIFRIIYSIMKKEATNLQTLQKVALALTIFGAICWGLIGIFEYDLIESIFGSTTSIISKIVYSLIALSGIINIGILFDDINTKHDR